MLRSWKVDESLNVEFRNRLIQEFSGFPEISAIDRQLGQIPQDTQVGSSTSEFTIGSGRLFPEPLRRP